MASLGSFYVLTFFTCVCLCAFVDAEEKWSGCWTRFPSSSTICRSEMGDEWEDTQSESCGFASLGKKVLCKNSYAGCKATACYSALMSRSALCEKEFGTSLPVTKGGFEDCSPGFYRARCCSQ